MNWKHFLVVTAGVYVGSTFIAPLVLQNFPAASNGQGLTGAFFAAGSVALGVILVDKLI